MLTSGARAARGRCPGRDVLAQFSSWPAALRPSRRQARRRPEGSAAGGVGRRGASGWRAVGAGTASRAAVTFASDSPSASASAAAMPSGPRAPGSPSGRAVLIAVSSFAVETPSLLGEGGEVHATGATCAAEARTALAGRIPGGQRGLGARLGDGQAGAARDDEGADPAAMRGRCRFMPRPSFGSSWVALACEAASVLGVRARWEQPESCLRVAFPGFSQPPHGKRPGARRPGDAGRSGRRRMFGGSDGIARARHMPRPTAAARSPCRASRAPLRRSSPARPMPSRSAASPAARAMSASTGSPMRFARTACAGCSQSPMRAACARRARRQRGGHGRRERRCASAGGGLYDCAGKADALAATAITSRGAA